MTKPKKCCYNPTYPVSTSETMTFKLGKKKKGEIWFSNAASIFSILHIGNKTKIWFSSADFVPKPNEQDGNSKATCLTNFHHPAICLEYPEKKKYALDGDAFFLNEKMEMLWVHCKSAMGKLFKISSNIIIACEKKYSLNKTAINYHIAHDMAPLVSHPEYQIPTVT